MKRRVTKLACVLSAFLLLGAVAWAGDGQIDIAEIPYTISSSGSYIVVDDLSTTATDTNGIYIDADNVTLNLNGHALTGPGKAAGTSGDGIYVNPSHYNIAICNGTVRDWRGNGVGAASADNSQFEALRCYNNGTNGIASGVCAMVNGNSCRDNGFSGIFGDTNSTFSDNSCYNNTWDGITAGAQCTITGNTSGDNASRGIYAGAGSTVSKNTCQNNAAEGIEGGGGCTVSGNTCRINGTDGISVGSGGAVSGNTCNSNTGDGIQASWNCHVVDNTCDSNGSGGDGAGILATSSQNRITDNHCTDNDRGLDLDGANNIISGNTLIGNTTPLDAVAGNQLDILISELPYTISQPGMYRLTGDLSLSTQDTNGITIDADNVTLDLNGHSLTGPGKAAGSWGNGIYVNSMTYNIAIRNGTVRDWRGIGIGGGSAWSSQFEALRCYNNGGTGISVGPGSTVTGTTSSYNGMAGIWTSDTCTVSGNVCRSNTYHGIVGSPHCTVSGNTCAGNGSDGINANNCVIRGNTCDGNTGDGIDAFQSLVTENCCRLNSGTGLNLSTCTASNNHS